MVRATMMASRGRFLRRRPSPVRWRSSRRARSSRSCARSRSTGSPRRCTRSAHLVLHAFDRGFGGQAGAHRVAHALAPALIVGEQAIGLDHLAALAGQVEFAGVQHLVDAFAQGRRWRLPDAFSSSDRIVGDHALDLDARLVQHHVSDRDAFRQSVAVKFARPVDAQFRLVEFGDIEEAALRHDFGQHHGDGLQRLDFLLGVEALRRWFCTVSTPNTWPPRTIGTPRNDLYGSSPVSGR